MSVDKKTITEPANQDNISVEEELRDYFTMKDNFAKTRPSSNPTPKKIENLLDSIQNKTPGGGATPAA